MEGGRHFTVSSVNPEALLENEGQHEQQAHCPKDPSHLFHSHTLPVVAVCLAPRAKLWMSLCKFFPVACNHESGAADCREQNGKIFCRGWEMQLAGRGGAGAYPASNALNQWRRQAHEK